MRTVSDPARDLYRAELVRVVGRLEASGDLRAVIRVVEAWDREGEVPLSPLLAQARAFLGLRLMDRAWVRLRQAAELSADDPETLALTARVFIERGWPSRARKVVERLREIDPEHPRLAELAAGAAAPAVSVPSDAREIEKTGDDAALLALAERYLAAGSMLRARSLLERVRRSSPHLDRAELLLWGLQGEYLPRNATLAGMLSAHRPVEDWEGADRTESVRRADLGAADPPTAEVTRAHLVEAGLVDAPGTERFPSLFRQAPEAHLSPDDEDEVTVATRLGQPDGGSDASGPAGEGTDPSVAAPRHGEADDGGDTQIMQVIPGPGGSQLEPVSGPLHERRSETEGANLRETLDLKAWQQSMGMGAEGEEEDEDWLEAEDEDLVVLTRREDDESEEAPVPARRSGPIEVIEKHPEPPANIGPPPDAPIEELAAAARPERAWLRLALAVAAMVVVMGGAAMVSVRYLHHAAGADAVAEVGAAMGDAGYEELLELQARLRAEVDAGAAPLDARAASLALVEAVLWGEYTGAPDHRDGARQALSLAREEGADGAALALATGTLALVEGDVDAAARASEEAGADTPGGRSLAASVALASGRPADGLALLADGEALGRRDQLLRVRLLDAAGRADEAAALLASLPADRPEVAVLSAIRRVDGDDLDGALTAVRETREAVRGRLAPRQLGRLFAGEARLLARAGRADEAEVAWQRAVSVDGHNPEVLYELGALSLLDNRPDDALEDFEDCAEAMPWYLPCQRGRVETLIDLDRLDEAAEVAGDQVALASRVSASAADGQPALEALAAAADADASVAVLHALGQALVAADRRSEADEVLARAAVRGARSTDPLDRRAAGRAAALRVMVAPEDRVEARVEEALALGDGDPVVHVRIAQRYESLDQKAAAAKHLARATREGPRNALAWHARGHFYFEPATMAEATWAWEQYLALGPSGARAEQARSRLR